MEGQCLSPGKPRPEHLQWLKVLAFPSGTLGSVQIPRNTCPHQHFRWQTGLNLKRTGSITSLVSVGGSVDDHCL
jgi:hypothetical protein